MCTFKLHYWPVFTALWFVITFTTSYLVAVLGGNVYSFFPYISDTGTIPPESCIFGQMLNMGALFMAITMYIRHVQVQNGIDVCDDTKVTHVYNKCSTTNGMLACFGTSLVANFQETNIETVHFVGALISFGCGVLYFVQQTRISMGLRNVYHKNPDYGPSRLILTIRVFIGIILLPLFIGHVACVSLTVQFYGAEIVLWWTEDKPGFQLRLAATFSEWALALIMLVYTSTFTNEFKAIKYIGVQFECLYK